MQENTQPSATVQKRIVMLQGMGLNERGWARLISRFGRVVLIQQGFIDHGEVWENEQCVLSGPVNNVAGTRLWDDLTFSALTMLRTLKCCRTFTKGETIDLMIAGSYGMALVALFLRATGKTRKVVCTVVDHLPPRGGMAVRVHRCVTRFLTHWVARHADEVWAISSRIPTAKANPRNFVIPFWIDDNGVPLGPREEIGYIGFPSSDHALDILFDIGQKHGFRLNIIGDSPYLQSIKHLAPPDTVFHGIVSDNVKIKNILSRCFCGYVVYRNIGPQSYSYYGFPSKTLSHFANNTPVLTTHTSCFTEDIEKLGVGRVVEPVPEQIEKALLDLKARYPVYYAAINRFRASWNANVEKFHDERMTKLLVDE